ncbi:hypothetical protein G9X43_07785 [Cronobacter turicensis]|uniref:hypothetical protein n=1 Tax=Cronobacter turicensis TaxID=413502 RepID=UPI0014136699|nr:hypothetical protein [Cronobacter turicensis]NHV08315.1 hypothetical protein [Cronobacter turicensis]NHV62799.1 hypothetical protein [Cronobacter turicensis]NHW09740.1 hypothetical protein [Cronobacter turicensis]
MSEEKYVEYLVLGGLRHGEVWIGPIAHGNIDIPAKEDNRLGKFYSRDAEAEISTPLDDTYFISEFVLKNGDKYMIASTEPLSAFDVEKEIEAVNPPLKPIK